jgi:hypothetical protein
VCHACEHTRRSVGLSAEPKRRSVCRAKSPFEMEAYRPSCSDTCPREFARIVHDCIKSNPSMRPNAADVVHRLNLAIERLCPLKPGADDPVSTGAPGMPRGPSTPSDLGRNAASARSSNGGSHHGRGSDRHRPNSANGYQRPIHANTTALRATKPKNATSWIPRCFARSSVYE